MDFEKMSESEILRIANPMMDNLMEAYTEIDHGRHVRDITDRMKNISIRFANNIKVRKVILLIVRLLQKWF
jgi:KaiC/GvpD/RAD55 family RecA-like ATPase